MQSQTAPDDPETVTVTVQPISTPTFDFTFDIDPDETEEEARDRALELAKQQASVALGMTAAGYDWQEVPQFDPENKIGELVIGADATYQDIENMIDMGLESVPGIALQSHQNGTYTILDENK